jgi:hypothetical protein
MKTPSFSFVVLAAATLNTSPERERGRLDKTPRSRSRLVFRGRALLHFTAPRRMMRPGEAGNEITGNLDVKKSR